MSEWRNYKKIVLVDPFFTWPLLHQITNPKSQQLTYSYVIVLYAIYYNVITMLS